MINKTTPLTASREDIDTLFPTLEKRINKGDMGRVLCICGSYDPHGAAMCGAAYFSAAAAYKCGAGIVEVFTHRKNYESLASLLPEAVYSLYDTEKEGANAILFRLAEQIKIADSIVLGCGLGKSELSGAIVKITLEEAKCPLVVDADGLNIISEIPELQKLISDRKNDTVITPHPGEMSRLIGKPISEILENTETVASTMAEKLSATVLLKDHNTVITNGSFTFVNRSGNAGMASAGMGDVLAGIIGALLARDNISDSASAERLSLPSVLYRTATAAYIHGLAGDIARRELGEYSLTARDVIESIYKAIKNVK